MSTTPGEGQQAMALARLYPEVEKGGRGKKSDAINSAETQGFSGRRLNAARSVLAYSRPLAQDVLNGNTTLDDALKQMEAERLEARKTQLKTSARRGGSVKTVYQQSGLFLQKLKKTIPCVVLNLESVLAGEYAENEFRKNFTPSERAAIGKAIEEEIGRRKPGPKSGPIGPQLPGFDYEANRKLGRAAIGKAIEEELREKERRGGDRKSNRANARNEVKGKSVDIAARRSGFKSAETYERAKTVTDKDAAIRNYAQMRVIQRRAKRRGRSHRASGSSSKRRKQVRFPDRVAENLKAAGRRNTVSQKMNWRRIWLSVKELSTAPKSTWPQSESIRLWNRSTGARATFSRSMSIW